MAESNCSYNMQEVTAIGVVLGITTVISCLSCLFALFLVILFQKYRSSTQRVIVYLTVSVLVYSVVEFLQATTVNVQESVTEYCAVMGFLDQYVAWMILMAITCLTTDLFVKVVFKWETTKRMEIFYVSAIYLSPILHTWVPFTVDAYGRAGAFCWIKHFENYVNCTQHIPGTIMQFVFYWIPLYIIGTLILVAYVRARIKASNRLNMYRGKYDPNTRLNQEKLLKEVDQYKYYPIIYIVINFPPVVARLVDLANIEYREVTLFLGLLHAFCIGLQGTLIALAFALDKDSCRKIKWSNIKIAVVQLCRKERPVTTYPVHQTHTDSLKRKSQVGSVRNGNTITVNNEASF